MPHHLPSDWLGLIAKVGRSVDAMFTPLTGRRAWGFEDTVALVVAAEVVRRRTSRGNGCE
jgi:hypothetical protein